LQILKKIAYPSKNNPEIKIKAEKKKKNDDYSLVSNYMNLLVTVKQHFVVISMKPKQEN
jgi:hypothetical protein